MSNDRLLEFTVFVRAVELGSFTGAARELSLGASAVSKIITRLEGRLGVRLLNRTSRSLGLTPDGQTFIAGARRVLEAVNDAESLVSVSASRPRGKIRIYSLPTFAYRLAPLFGGFVALHPEVILDVQLGTDRIDLVKYGFDIAIRLGALEDSGAFSRKIAETGWVVCASPTYLARHGVPQVPIELSQHNCLNFSIHTHALDWQFRGEPLAARPSISGNLLSNQAEMLRLLALQGLGIIRVSEHVVAEDLAQGRLTPLLEAHLPKQHDPVWAIYQTRNHLSLRVRMLIDYLAEHLATPAAR